MDRPPATGEIGALPSGRVQSGHQSKDSQQGEDRRRKGPQESHATEPADQQVDRGNGPSHEHGRLEQVVDGTPFERKSAAEHGSGVQHPTHRHEPV